MIQKILKDSILEAKNNIDVLLADSKLHAEFEKMIDMMVTCYKNGGGLFVAGNGGSAADAQHFVAESVVKLSKNRDPIKAFALTVDTSIITAAGNDFSYDDIFSRQVEGLMGKNDIFIGAPSADVIKARAALGTAETAYFKNQDSSPQLSGLSKTGTYFTASHLICDGDLVINGTLFLKDLTLTTNEGCRIMVTGPIFVNGKITYVQHTSNSTNDTNLQLVSSTWINLGVGLTNCENDPNYPTAEKAWYRTNSTLLQDPMTHRLKIYASKSRLNQQDVNALRTIQSSIATFQDASCRKSVAGEFPREEHFERLLLNAPRVDSRYTGQFTGVIIAETALMGLSSFSFSFDPVFSRVPVLPLLKPSDYLVVK